MIDIQQVKDWPDEVLLEAWEGAVSNAIKCPHLPVFALERSLYETELTARRIAEILKARGDT